MFLKEAVFATDASAESWSQQLQSSMDGAHLPRSLRAICCKAMTLHADQRYPSARTMAEDIELALADEPVSVCSDPLGTRLRRWIQRKPAIAAAGLATASLTFVGLAVFSWLTSSHSVEIQTKNEQLDSLYQQEKELRRTAQESEKRTSNALDFMSDALRSPDPNLKGRDVRVVDQLASAIEKLETNYRGDPLLQARVLNEIGYTYYGLSEFQYSAKLLQRARDLYHEQLGEDDLRTLVAGKNLGETWLRLNDDRAFEQLESVYQKADSLFGPEDRVTINFKRVFTESWIKRGMVQDAISELNKLVSLHRQTHRDASNELITLQSSLAKAYAAAGQHVKAAELTKWIHEQRLQRDGEHSLTAITSGYNYVKFLRKTNQRDQVAELLEVLLARARSELGNDHFQSILLIKELGQVYLANADRERGIPLIEEAWERIVAKYGAEHSLAVSTANSLGFAYMARGNYEKAAMQFKSTYERALRIYGPQHSETLTLANNLGMSFQLSEQFADAIEVFEDTIASQKKLLGKEHPNTILTMLNYAGALRSSGRFEDAIRVCREVAELAESLERDHFYSQIAMLIEGTARLRMKDFESAYKVIAKCHESRIRTAPKHWQRFHTMSLLGEALMGLEDYSAAEPLLLESYEKLVQLESKIPQRVKSKIVEARHRIAKLYEAQNLPEKAASYRDEELADEKRE